MHARAGVCIVKMRVGVCNHHYRPLTVSTATYFNITSILTLNIVASEALTDPSTSYYISLAASIRDAVSTGLLMMMVEGEGGGW